MAITRRQLGTNANKTGTTLTITVGTTPSIVGSYILVGVACDTQPSTISFGGNALSLLKSIRNVGNLFTQIWGLDDCPIDGGDIILTFAGADARAAFALSVTEVHELDQSATGASAGTTPNTGTTGTTTDADEFVCYAIGTEGPDGDAAGTWTAPANAGQRLGTTGGAADTNQTISEGWQIVSATGTFAGAKTGITSRDWAACVVTLKSTPQNGSSTPVGATGIYAQAGPGTLRANYIGTIPSSVTAQFGQLLDPRFHLTTTPTQATAQFTAIDPAAYQTATPGGGAAAFAGGTPEATLAMQPTGGFGAFAGAIPSANLANLAAQATALFSGGIPVATLANSTTGATAAFAGATASQWHLGAIPTGALASFQAAVTSIFHLQAMPSQATAQFAAQLAEYFIFVTGAIILAAKHRLFDFTPKERALSFSPALLTFKLKADERNFSFPATERLFSFEA